ncbi:MAG: hypothetical protein Ct9H300mP8_11360 [Gammaproteobacteria bacterium]|nr:MAG: hypothetical protein Ct9H300mP8_11360 [Gammaproteobacteria bacterium]
MNPQSITYHAASRTLELCYADGSDSLLPAELLRVYSPSAEGFVAIPRQNGRYKRARNTSPSIPWNPLEITRYEFFQRWTRHWHLLMGLPRGIVSSQRRVLAEIHCRTAISERVKITHNSRRSVEAGGGVVNQRRVNFGHDFVDPDEKTRRVGSVFRTVAKRYDVMNDVMSFGLHRIFKRIAIETTSLRPRSKVLDVAGGTGDLCALLADVVGRKAK